MMHTYRPLGARIAVAIVTLTLVGAIAVLWVALPGEVQDDFTWVQRVTLLLLFAVTLAALWGLFRTSVRTGEAGLEIVNVFKVRTYQWPQVVAISMRRGDPWAVLDLADGTSVVAMAIQSSDGARAAAAVRDISQQIDQHSRTERDD
jgi:hypothetical protein